MMPLDIAVMMNFLEEHMRSDVGGSLYGGVKTVFIQGNWYKVTYERKADGINL